jgi:hypothetical protein
VYTREVDIFNIVCGVVVLDLAACPVHAFDLYHFAILNRSSGGN